VGVYKARCECSKYFQAPIPGVPYKGKYSYEVRNVVANALIRDQLPYRLVQQRLQEDFRLMLSLGYIHACFLWAHARFNREAHWRFVQANFSGVLCIDEVHDSGRTLLFATDPLNNFTVFFQVVKKNDQPHMDAFLQQLKGRGLEVLVAITDGSPLYKDSLQSYWADIVHQLCVFHVIKTVCPHDAAPFVSSGTQRISGHPRRTLTLEKGGIVLIATEHSPIFDEVKKMGATLDMGVPSIHCRATSTLAYCVMEYDFSAMMPDSTKMTQPSRTSLVLRKGEDGWKWAHWHTSLATVPTPPAAPSEP